MHDNSPLASALRVCLRPKILGCVMIEAYLDETGDDGSSPLIAVGGYLIEYDAARTMERDWQEMLDEAGIDYFHMVDCAHGNELFEGHSKSERSNIASKAIDIIKRHVAYSFMCATPSSNIRQVDHHISIEPLDLVEKRGFHFKSLEKIGAYELCARACLQGVDNYARGLGHRGVALFYEQGHRSRTLAQRHIQDYIGKSDDLDCSYSFIPKGASGIIQAADMLVWQHQKYLRDGALKKRKIRKDYESMLEVPGKFLHHYRDGHGEFSNMVDNKRLLIEGVRDRIGTIFDKERDEDLIYSEIFSP